MSNQANFISLDGAAKALKVDRSTVYYYLEQLGIAPKKFELDRRSYITIDDLKRIKAARESAVARRAQEVNVT